MEALDTLLEGPGVERFLKGFEFDDMGEPITKGLRISMLPAGESADGNALLRWSRSGFGNSSRMLGVDGREIGWTFGNGGGNFGVAVAEGIEELDPEEVLVFIFKSGGAIGRLGGGVDEDDLGGLGFLKKEGGGVCVVEVVPNDEVFPLTGGVVIGSAGAKVGIEGGLASGARNFAVSLDPLIVGVSGWEKMDALDGGVNSAALGFKVDDVGGVQGEENADVFAFVLLKIWLEEDDAVDNPNGEGDDPLSMGRGAGVCGVVDFGPENCN